MTQDVFSSGNKKSNPRFPLGCFVAVLRCAGASYLPGITPTLSKRKGARRIAREVLRICSLRFHYKSGFVFLGKTFLN